MFGHIIHLTAAGRYHFNDKIRGSFTASIGEFVRITDHTDIWFYPVPVIGIKIDSKWCRDNFALPTMFFDMSADYLRKLRN